MTLRHRILVTGGSGTVGSGLSEELRGRGHRVVSCDVAHRADEVGFSLRTDVREPLFARSDTVEVCQLQHVNEYLGDTRLLQAI